MFVYPNAATINKYKKTVRVDHVYQSVQMDVSVQLTAATVKMSYAPAAPYLPPVKHALRTRPLSHQIQTVPAMNHTCFHEMKVYVGNAMLTALIARKVLWSAPSAKMDISMTQIVTQIRHLMIVSHVMKHVLLVLMKHQIPVLLVRQGTINSHIRHHV